MTSITVSGTQVSPTPAQIVEFRPTGRHVTQLLPNPSHRPKEDEPVISLYQADTEFSTRCCHSLLLSSAETSRNPFFHQACVFVPQHDELYITSDLLRSSGSSSSLPVVLISRVKLHRNDTPGADSGGRDGCDGEDVVSVEWQKLRPPQSMAMPAGGTSYADGMVFCSQGNLARGTGGLYYMPRGRPPQALVAGFYGRDFNSPHDVVLARDGALWFTDPCHGFQKNFRRRPVLPCHVYRFSPDTGDLRVVENGLNGPMSIAFSPDENTAYIVDTDAGREDSALDSSRFAIYAYDVITRDNSQFLGNRRVFAVPLSGFPMGVKCDDRGQVYVGCADGIDVWSAGGILQAVIEVPGGVTNFCFGRCDATKKEIFACAQQRLWRLRFER